MMGSRATPEPESQMSRIASDQPEPSNIPAQNSNMLFDALYNNNSAIDSLIREWTDAYASDQVDAMVELVNFVIQSTGCQQSIERSVFDEEKDITEVLANLQQQFNAQKQNDYPIMAKGKANLKFKRNLLEFWKKWTLSLKSGILYEEESWCIESIKSWIMTMSSSPFRPFRHTSTVFCLTVLSSLCEIANTVHQEWTIANRQLNAEKKKSSSSKKLKQLSTFLDELKQKKDILQEQMEDIFDGVFVHRYRDSDPIIRTECIKELGNWILKFPETYLDPQYLRYIGWMLSDKIPAVRQEALKLLNKLYKVDTMVSGLRELTERFKKRIIEMATKEKDHSSQIHAIHLIMAIAKCGLLSETDSEQLLPLLCVEDFKVRNAIAAFAVEVFQEDFESPALENLEISRQSKKTEELQLEAKFEAFADFLYKTISLAARKEKEGLNEENVDNEIESIQYTQEERIENEEAEERRISLIKFMTITSSRTKIPEYLHGLSEERLEAAILAMFPHLPLLKELQFLGSYLSKDLTIQDDQDVERELVLLSSFASLLSNSLPSDKKTSRHQDEDIVQLNRKLVSLLPELLNKYVADYATDVGSFRLMMCFKILRSMDLNVYKDMHLEIKLDDLINDVFSVFMKLTELNALKECALTLAYIIDPESYNDPKNLNKFDSTSPLAMKVRDFVRENFDTLEADVEMQSIQLNEKSKLDNTNDLAFFNTRVMRLQTLVNQFPDFLFGELSQTSSPDKDLFAFGNNLVEYCLALLKTQIGKNQQVYVQSIIQHALTMIESHIAFSLKRLFDQAYPNGFPESLPEDSDSRLVIINEMSAEFQERFKSFKLQSTQFVQVCEALLITDVSESSSMGMHGMRVAATQILTDVYLLLNGDCSLLLPGIELKPDRDIQVAMMDNLNTIAELVYLNRTCFQEKDLELVLILKNRILAVFVDIAKLAQYGLLEAPHVCSLIKYYGLHIENTIFGHGIESLIELLSEQILSKPLFNRDLLNNLNMTNSYLEEATNVIFSALQKAFELYASVRVKTIDPSIELAKQFGVIIKNWTTHILQAKDFTITEMFSLKIIDLMRRAIDYSSKLILIWKHGLRSKKNEMVENINDMTFDMEELSVYLAKENLTQKKRELLLSNLEQLNQIWKVWTVLGGSVHYACSMLNKNDKLDLIQKSFEDAISLLTSKGLPPSESDPCWAPFFEFAKCIEKGEIMKKATRTKVNVSSKKDRTSSRKIVGMEVNMTPKTKRSRKSLSSKDQADKGEDDVSTSRSATRLGQKRKELERLSSSESNTPLRRSSRAHLNKVYVEPDTSEDEEEEETEEMNENGDQEEDEIQDEILDSSDVSSREVSMKKKRNNSEIDMELNDEESQRDSEVGTVPPSSPDLISRKKIRI